MKNYSNPSLRRRSDKSTSLNLNQSLFMDETSADLENYLNSSLPETSSVTSEQISYVEQELGCSTNSALSKSIIGKFQKRSRDSRKNKFFKSKSSEDIMAVNTCEIPVINEAMKKILKETPFKPTLKHSPKALKTYSNKNKDKSQIVESFGLPDEPFLSPDAKYSKEQNSIDLDIEPENHNLNKSLILGQWMPSDSIDGPEININDDFRRKSFSAIDDVLFAEGSLETEVREGFNFEEENSAQDGSKPSNEENIRKKNESPVVLLKSLNLNDISLLQANNLSPSKNKRNMLLQRWQKFNSKLKIRKGKIIKKCSGIALSKASVRRSTRSNISTVEVEGCANNLPKNADNSMIETLDTNSGSRPSELKDNDLPGIVKERNEKTPEETNLERPDNPSPRRTTRRSAQQTVDSLPVNNSNELCSSNFKSPVQRNENIVSDNTEVTSSKKGRRSKPLKSDVKFENELNIMNSPSESERNDANNASENLTDVTSPSNSRNVRTSLRSSMKLKKEMKSSPSGEQKLLQNITSINKENRDNIQKELEHLSEKTQIHTMLKVDNSSISVSEGSIGMSNNSNEIIIKEDKSNINNQSSSSSSKSKKSNKTKILDISQEAETSTRKSNRLKLQYDENFKHPVQSIGENLNKKNTPNTKNNDVEMDLKSAAPKENEKIDGNMETFTYEKASHVQVRRSKGRSCKKKLSDLQNTSELSLTSEDQEITQKSNTDTKLPEKQIAACLNEFTKTAEDNSNMEFSEINNVSQHQSNEEKIRNKAESIIEHQNEVQVDEKECDEPIKSTDSEIDNKEIIIPNLNNQGPTKRKRGRPRKKIVLEQKEFKPKNNGLDEKREQSTNGDKDKIIEDGVNNKELISDVEENTKNSAKEGDEEKEICESSVIFQSNDESKTNTKDHLVKIQSDEVERTHVNEEKEISGESNIEQTNGRKRKLCEEFQILESFQGTESDEKFGEYIKEKLEDQTNDTTLETEFKSSKIERCDANDQGHHHSIDEKNLNGQKVDKTFSGSSEVLNSFGKTCIDKESKKNMKEIDNSNVTVEYSDFGYDIHRRTSFRKLLERVMEASRSEMEMVKSETIRNERCKSVPLEEFHRRVQTIDVGMKSASADSKLKYLKDKKNSNANIDKTDLSRVKKCLDYNSHSKSSDKKFLSRKRAKSVHVVNGRLDDAPIHPQTEKDSCLEEIKSSMNGNVSMFNGRKEIIPGLECSITHSNENINYDRQKKLQDDSKQNFATCLQHDAIDKEDLEVQNLLLKNISTKVSYERNRSKSFSEGSSIQKFKSRPKSVQGRRLKKKNRSYGGTNGFTEVIKKVYEFKVGDTIWGKVGKYPYWPGLIMEDPETSDFKKFRLLRTTPYYHIRFFGDNGKRAWTSYCIPYEGPQDLDKLQEQFSVEGIQNEYLVKAAQLEKWKKAVEEAEKVKGYPLEKKIEFFNKSLPTKGRSHILEDTEDILTENLKKVRSKSFSCTTNMPDTNSLKSENDTLQKGKIPMKISSLLSCIEDVVKNFNNNPSESKRNVSPSRKKNSPIKDNSFSTAEEVVTNSVKNAEKTSTEMKNKVSPPKKRSIPMKESSVLACINDVVKKYSSPNVQGSDGNSTKTKTREWKKKMEDADSDTDIGLELLDIPKSDLPIASSQKIDFKSPEKNSLSRSSEQSTSTGTPVSSRRTPVISPTRTRSRSSLKLEKRRLSDEFKDDEPEVLSKEPKANVVLSCSPRRLKLKRRTIEMGRTDIESETSASFLKNIASRLPEHKKNLFRGVTKEKVCQICEKPGDVVKCRGPCNGDFHIKCVEKSLKETEELTLKEQEELILKEKCESASSQVDELMEDNKQVQISTVISKKKFADGVILSPINRKIPMMEQFDRKMKELMSQVESRISIDSTDSSSEEIDTLDKIQADKKSNGKNSKKQKGAFKHVTADDVSMIRLSNGDASKQKPTPSESSEQTSNADEGVYKCSYCISTVIPLCFVCNSIVSKKGSTMRQRCSLQKCGRYYHLECLNVWHQTQWSFILHDKRKTEALDSFVCPRHSCHICASENLGFSMGRCPNDKLVKCLRCPATYHNSYHCVPAGTEILTSTQIICPRHVQGNKKPTTLNTIWCFVCSEGGNLICCETCPTSVHSECLPVNLLDDDTYICEDCESGRFPLYDEVVWVKCGTFRWWPAIILFPSEVPANVDSKPHSKGEFVVKFFGTYNYFWVGRGRVFLYQEGDTGYLNNTKNKIDEAFSTAIKEAADVYGYKKGLRAKKQKEVNTGLKPPTYVRIKVNRPVGNVRVFEGNLSNTTPCDCNPKDKNPCGPNSNCLNRILLTECNPEICPAGERCKNQAFEKREYPQVKPYRTAGRGWGLKTLEPIKKGQFVIEYVGEIIDDEEYQRRITRMHQQKDENYYFLTIDKDRMLDAGPKGNVARFMNHSCQPNCETQKWTVNGDTRVGLFAIDNISVDTELTFNYNLECAGTEKKICRCGAPNCSGFIGVKPEDQRASKKNSTVKPIEQERPSDTIVNDSCFICGQPGDVGKCTHKSCLNSYHLECVQLNSWPKGKWFCPSHTCNICSKSTTRICVHCNNSYCPNHLEGNIRHDSLLGFLCSQHDQAIKKSTRKKSTAMGNLDSSSSNGLNTSRKRNLVENEKSETLRSERYRKRTSCFETNIPQKKLKLND